MRTFRHAMCTVTLAVVLAACGDQDGSPDPATSNAPDARLFGDCRADDAALDKADVVAEADLDGSGATNEVAYVPPAAGGPCANALVTTFDGEATAVSAGEQPLDPGSVRVVQLEGTARQLVVAQEKSHPRGGYMVHLYGGADQKLSEILVDGEPLVGFIATDGGTAPATASCTEDGGLAKLSASIHEPPGVAAAWDVTKTTYQLDGNSATETSSEQVREDASDPVLRQEMPQLFEPEGYFADCLVEPSRG